jgi:8-oxo-dGTP diphosphatase
MTPKTTVAAIVSTLNDSSRILLTRRNIEPFRDHWCLPGGHIDQYESAREAVIREVKEETGLDFEPEFIGYFDEIIPKIGLHAVVLVFRGPGVGMLSREPSEVSEIGWFSRQETDAMALAFLHNQVLKRYAAGDV